MKPVFAAALVLLVGCEVPLLNEPPYLLSINGAEAGGGRHGRQANTHPGDGFAFEELAEVGLRGFGNLDHAGILTMRWLRASLACGRIAAPGSSPDAHSR